MNGSGESVLHSSQKSNVHASGKLAVIGAKPVCQKGSMCSEDEVFRRACENVAAKILDGCRQTVERVLENDFIDDINKRSSLGAGSKTVKVLWGETHGGADEIKLGAFGGWYGGEPSGAFQVMSGAPGEFEA